MKVVLLLIMFLASFDALACSVCGFGQDGSQWAFIFTTGLLTALPLTMFGLIFYFVRRHIKKQQDEV